MVLWGAILGCVFALLAGRPSLELALLGAVIGGVGGVVLRNAVRAEVKTMLAATGVVAPVAPAVPRATTDGFAPTQPHAPAAPAASAASAATIATIADAVPPPPTVVAAAPPSLTAVPVPPVTARPIAPAAARVTDPDLLFARVRQWLLGGNTVVRMGVLVLFVGLAFLAKYAIDNALLPPELRLAAIGAAGIALFGAGFRLQRRRADRLAYALTLEGAGVAVLYLTVFAAFRLYQFLPAGAAFAALGLVCAFSAVIAVAQNAPAMAFIGFAGAFAAPILVSAGQGSHVGLFSYYLLLGVAIAALSWVKAWRPLNLLGFFATFGVATLWGVLQYRPQHFATTEPFLIAFFLVYLAASVLYATRHALAPRRAVDATLIFGTPLVAFGLQAALVRPFEYATALSALDLGALYLFLAWLMLRAARAAEGEQRVVRRWLAESFLALGVGFATLAVPLALDGRWTAATWAVEGAGVFWMGRRQDRWLARAAGLVLQLLAGLTFLQSDGLASASAWPFANARFIGASMLAGAAFGISWWSRELRATATAATRAAAFERAEHVLSPVLFWVAFLWWQYALGGEIRRAPVNPQGLQVHLFEPVARMHLLLLAWVGSAFAAHVLAVPARRRPWPVAATPAYTVLPVMLVTALGGIVVFGDVFRSWGWAAWTVALLLHFTMLRRLDAGPPRAWWNWVHAGGVWLLVLLAASALYRGVDAARLWNTDWAAVIALLAGTAVLALLSRRAWFAAAAGAGRWPLSRYASAYLWRAALPLWVFVSAATVLTAVHSAGDTRPLPYVPVLNPTELAAALALAVCVLWLQRIRAGALDVPPWARDPRWLLVPAASAFVVLNTVWLRMAHQYAGVAWQPRALFDSFLVQAGYSVLWTLVAVVLMVAAHRRAQRAPWLAGAALLGLTVLKMFVIDLSNRGGSERIVAFIAVGLLMLVVGYFAPVPPGARRDAEPVLKEMGT